MSDKSAAELAAELARLRRTIGAVRVLHARVEWRGQQVCGGCSDGWGDAHVWPCPTVRALDEETAA